MSRRTARCQRYRIGVDLGGTKIEAAALDPVRRRLSSPGGAATPPDDYRRTLEAIAELVGAAIRRARPDAAAVGIGIPGTISPATGLVKNANSTWLIGQPLQRDLEAALGRPVRLANDANCFALSEATDGAAAGARTVFGVILGTGVGGGIVIDGRLLAGANAIAGEWGHNPLPWPTEPTSVPAPRCYCGRARLHRDLALAAPPSPPIIAAHTGRTLEPQPRSPQAAAAGDAAAQSRPGALRRPAGARAGGRHQHPRSRRIVLGGGLSSIAQPLRARAAAAGAAMSSPTRSRPGSCRRCMATPAACAAPPGCGRRQLGDRALPRLRRAAHAGRRRTLRRCARCRDCGSPRIVVTPSWPAFASPISIATPSTPRSRSATTPSLRRPAGHRRRRRSAASSPPAAMSRGSMACARRCRCSRRCKLCPDAVVIPPTWRNTARSAARCAR